MRIDWISKAQVGLQTVAFCLAISGLHYAFNPQRPYEVSLVYSLCIGLSSWLLIDFGAELFPSAHETGWPSGVWGALLPVLGVTLGFAIGTTLADAWFGWSSWTSLSRRQLFLMGLISAVIGIVITYFFYSRGRSAHLSLRVDEANRLATEARLKLLQAQLEPHMLFNTLANLRVLIGIDPVRAQAMLDHIIAFLRSTLSASRASHHALQEEFNRLEDYLALMAIRMGARLRFQLDLPPALAQVQVPTLILQPLVENSIRHGLEPKLEGGELTVKASSAQGQLVLEVCDTGLGCDAAQVLSSPNSTDRGFGLHQIKERLAALYGNAATIDFIAAHAQGTRAIIRLPLQRP